MAHFKQDPTTYFINKVKNPPTVNQQHIIDSMDSVQYTLIPYKRCYGTTKALTVYTEWEFSNSTECIKTSFIATTSTRYGMFDDIRIYSANRDRLEHNGNVIVLETPESVLKDGALRGLIPSDVYVFDASIGDLKIEHDVLRFIKETQLFIGRTTTHRIGESDLQNGRVVTKTYHGSRFVIVCEDIEYMTNALLDMGVDEDEISQVELVGEPIDRGVLLPLIRKIVPGLIAADLVGVQPMTAPVSQIMTLQTTTNTVSAQAIQRKNRQPNLQYHSPNDIITASP